MSRTKNAARNIIWGLINKFVALGIPFIVRTVLIYTLGVQYVGVGSLLSSLLSVLSFAELGIGNAMVYSMYKPIAEGDDKKVCALLNLYRSVYRIIGVVILLLGLFLLIFLENFVAGDVPTDINLRILFSIYLCNSCIGYFLFAYKQSVLIASQRMDLISRIDLMIKLIGGVVQVGTLVLFHNYYLYAVVLPLTTCLSNISVAIVSSRIYPQYFCSGYVSDNEKTSIKMNAGGMVFQKIGAIVLNSVDSIVISAFLGLMPLSIYQNYYYIITSLFGILGIFMQSIIASIGNSIATESQEKNYQYFMKFGFMYDWIVVWFTSCLLCLYQTFMRIWVGDKLLLSDGMVYLLCILFFVHKYCDVLYVFQEATGIWWDTRFVPFAAAMINLVINIILVQIVGLPGIVISTIIAVIVAYQPGYSFILFKVYFKDIKGGIINFWRRQVVYLASGIIVTCVTYIICSRIEFDSDWIVLIIRGVICAVVPNICLIILWSKLPEFKFMISTIKHYLKKMGIFAE